MSVLDVIQKAREAGDLGALVEAIPYARWLGFTVETREGEQLGHLRFAPHLVGNASVPALHGGTIGAMLESTAIFEVLLRTPSVVLPKTITFTVDYLRPARPADVWARATVTRQGRRVANVRATAFQEDPNRPIATANALFLVMAEGEGPTSK
jgi:uncharacterized protein (TIGR00369 family)